MKRGDIYFANLDPTVGSKIQKKRPVLIVSNNASNKASSLVTVVPITSNTAKVYPFEVFVHAGVGGLESAGFAPVPRTCIRAFPLILTPTL